MTKDRTKYTQRKACLVCGKPTYSIVGLHRVCRFGLPAGDWAPGVVQLWKAQTAAEPVITASPVHPRMRERLATLTEAEGGVLQLLACGHTPDEVAAIRTTSLATVRTQIKAITKKLGTQGRGYYGVDVALAWRSGWIKVADEAQGGVA